MEASGWRLLFLPHLFLALLQLLALCLVPESARWLAETGRLAEAHVAVRQLHGVSSALTVAEEADLHQRKKAASAGLEARSGRMTKMSAEASAHAAVVYELASLPAGGTTAQLHCIAAIRRWQPSFMLIVSVVTTGHSAGGLQVAIRGWKIFELVGLSEKTIYVMMLLSTLSASFGSFYCIESLGRWGYRCEEEYILRE